jgi:holo-[acyl-carrier protein] synthase
MSRFREVGVGIDIEPVRRFGLGKKSPLLRKIFTKKEMAYCFEKSFPPQHLAVRFAGKEAVIKALSGLGLKPPSLGEIEILNDRRGAPKVGLKKIYDKTTYVRLSLSHTSDLAVASAVAFQ